MGAPPSFKISAVMLSFPGALFRFSRLMAHSSQMVEWAADNYLGYLFEFARRAVLEVVWCYIEVGIELLTPLDHPVLVVDVRTVLFFQ